MLRRWNYRDYYHPNVSGDEEEHMLSHAGKEAIAIIEEKVSW